MKFKPIKRRENPSGIYRCGAPFEDEATGTNSGKVYIFSI